MITVKMYHILVALILVGGTFIQSFPVNLNDLQLQSPITPTIQFSANSSTKHVRKSGNLLDGSAQKGAEQRNRKEKVSPKKSYYAEPNIFDKYLNTTNGTNSPFNSPHPRSKRTLIFLVLKHGIKKFFKFFLIG